MVNRKSDKVVCRGVHGAFPFTLDEASQGTLAVSLDLGGTPPLCAVFGGFVSKDEVGKFKAKKASRARACP